MLDKFTYTELGGRRRLRRYVWAVLLLLPLILSVYGWGKVQSAQAAAVLAATPRPITTASAPAGTNPIETPFVTPPGAAQIGPTAPAPGPIPCPTAPEAWRLSQATPGDFLLRLPDCVVKSLDMIMAWHMLTQLGYSATEAAELLDLQAAPLVLVSQIVAATNTQERITLPVSMPVMQHPDLHQWRVTAAGAPAAAYSLRGCYRTRSFVGNAADDWGSPWPVQCTIAYDTAALNSSIVELGDLKFALHNQQPLRFFLALGYDPAHGWVFLGQTEWHPLDDPALAAEDRATVSARYGAPIWDAAWLEAAWGLAMRPLPENWQSLDADTPTIQTISDQLTPAP